MSSESVHFDDLEVKDGRNARFVPLSMKGGVAGEETHEQWLPHGNTSIG
ncbi:hypothetical protein ACFYRL_30475 [Streptomyces goshikiensis]